MLLLVAGAAMLAHVGWQLWGTGISTAHAQSRFRVELRRHGFPRVPVHAGAVGYIRIPRLALDMAFVQGIDQDALSRGPGHYPKTPLPGQAGNVVIAGHRTTHLAPFWSLDRIRPGDQVTLQTRSGTFVYKVQWAILVEPGNWSVTARTPLPSLTLTTCSPRFSARQRLIVRAVQVYGRTPAGFVDYGAGQDVPLVRTVKGRR